MEYESKVTQGEGGVEITTTGKETAVYPDIVAASQAIGRKRFWGWTKLLVGGSSTAVGCVGVLLESLPLLARIVVNQQPYELSNLFLPVLLTVGGYYLAKDGVRDGIPAESKEEALKAVSLNLNQDQSQTT